MLRDWDEHYASGDVPWDTGDPDPHLADLVATGTLVPGRVLEVGCGTGTNALWLADRGFQVHAVDISALAIERARAKQATAGVVCGFQVLDFLGDDPVGGPFDLVFDRGVFHVFDEAEERARFAARVAAVLAPGGCWVSLSGSTEGPARDHGPPRRTARDLVDAVEPALEIELLRTTRFHADLPTPAQAWLLVARRRSVPAQPSTRRA